MRSVRIAAVVLSASLVGSLMAVTAAQSDMIGVQFSLGNFQVDSINTTTGAQTALGSSGINRLNSLTVTPDGVLYSVGGPSTSNQSHLVTINPLTGAGTDLGTINYDIVPQAAGYGITGLASDASGMLYGTVFGESSLYRIDPSTKNATRVTANMGFGNIQSLEFSPAGTLYGVTVGTGSGGGLVTINTATGQATRVSQPADFPWAMQSIAFDNDGTLWGIGSSMGDPSGSGRIYTIDPLTGIATLKFGTGLSNDFRGIEFLAPVPVPAAVWLFGSGLAAMAGWARRKSAEL